MAADPAAAAATRKHIGHRDIRGIASKLGGGLRRPKGLRQPRRPCPRREEKGPKVVEVLGTARVAGLSRSGRESGFRRALSFTEDALLANLAQMCCLRNRVNFRRLGSDCIQYTRMLESSRQALVQHRLRGGGKRRADEIFDGVDDRGGEAQMITDEFRKPEDALRVLVAKVASDLIDLHVMAGHNTALARIFD